MHKGQHLTYRLSGFGRVSAIVRTVHRDGSVTVEARHQLKDGEPVGPYLGYKYRMDSSKLQIA